MESIKGTPEVSNWVIDVANVLKFAFIYIKLCFKFTLENKFWALETTTASSASNWLIISLTGNAGRGYSNLVR